VLGAWIVALGVGILGGAAPAMGFLALSGFFLFFFRDPDRVVAAAPGAVLAPADGRVLAAGAPTGQPPPGTWQQISIFLSPLDVHVNRVPVGGRVAQVKYHPGRYLPAYKPEAGDLNEFTEITLDHSGQAVIFRQIVGVLARRVVCRVREGDIVNAGDRFGIMKFGSRMDVFVPSDAHLKVRPGQRVVGGVTVIAELSR
jgi:phosphatidylserine decarboxylase